MPTPIATPPFLPSSAAPPAPSPVRAPVSPAPAGQPPARPFAQMLKQNQAPHANAAAPAAKAASPADDAGEPAALDSETAEAADANGRPDAPGHSRRARADERPAARAVRAAPKAADAEIPIGDAKAAETDDAATPTAIDPAFAAWLAERPQTPDARPRDATVPADPAAAERAVPDTAEATGARALSRPVDGANESDPKRVEADAKPEPKAFADLMAEHLAIEPQVPMLAADRAAAAGHAEAASTRLEAVAATPLFSAAAFTPAAGIAPLAAAVDVRLATPVVSPDFAQALGTQVSVLAGNGVQRAELHLNPAEMGPVSVQIVVDGAHARVDFGADLAATRQAIENGLPELASALRDAGLTLTGGGVSQHARGRGDRGADAGPNQGRSGRTGAEAEPVAPIRPRSIALGGVDLYA